MWEGGPGGVPEQGTQAVSSITTPTCPSPTRHYGFHTHHDSETAQTNLRLGRGGVLHGCLHPGRCLTRLGGSDPCAGNQDARVEGCGTTRC
eukprot:1150783-Pelagomonas_calceolata.AAC.4